MIQLAIRCHPCVPVAADELEQWLLSQVHDLRAQAPHGTVRLSRLTQGLPSVDLDIGWLVELELGEGEPLLGGHRLADALRDMRLLGLQPTLIGPRDVSDWTAAPAVAGPGGPAPGRPANGHRRGQAERQTSVLTEGRAS